jgi:hypothetical protein
MASQLYRYQPFPTINCFVLSYDDIHEVYSLGYRKKTDEVEKILQKWNPSAIERTGFCFILDDAGKLPNVYAIDGTSAMQEPGLCVDAADNLLPFAFLPNRAEAVQQLKLLEDLPDELKEESDFLAKSMMAGIQAGLYILRQPAEKRPADSTVSLLFATAYGVNFDWYCKLFLQYVANKTGTRIHGATMVTGSYAQCALPRNLSIQLRQLRLERSALCTPSLETVGGIRIAGCGGGDSGVMYVLSVYSCRPHILLTAVDGAKHATPLA